MFEVLVFVYENYWRGDACPEPEQLGRKLSAHGFEAEEIREAIHWLDGLSLATQGLQIERSPDDEAIATVVIGGRPEAALPQSGNAMRIYSQAEQDHLGAECLEDLEAANGLFEAIDPFAEAVGAGGQHDVVFSRGVSRSGVCCRTTGTARR